MCELFQNPTNHLYMKLEWDTAPFLFFRSIKYTIDGSNTDANSLSDADLNLQVYFKPDLADLCKDLTTG